MGHGGGGEKLTERLAIRPTSEVIRHDVRREVGAVVSGSADPDQPVGQRDALGKTHARPFLRTLELCGKKVTRRSDRARGGGRSRRACSTCIAMSPRTSPRCRSTSVRRARSERFAAPRTYSIEALMPDGKALQAATAADCSREFFARVRHLVSSRRSDAAVRLDDVVGDVVACSAPLIMVHGDDRGLHPAGVAPVEVVIVRSFAATVRRARCGARIARLQAGRLAREARRSPGTVARLRSSTSGTCAAYALRIEIETRDLEAGVATLVTRPRVQRRGQKRTVPLGAIVAEIPAVLDEIQASLFAQNRAFLGRHDLDERSCGVLPFARRTRRDDRHRLVQSPECEAAIKEASSATTAQSPPAGAQCNLRRVRRAGDGPGGCCQSY